ncbi:MAG: helix-turn-helix domain-containing protein [Oscillospiraceae bacterium]|jgi:transcriptional regulator with XRE-family HTH domain|nr:helix-turn-helix domain-containing protein [Oscillospiraceae bacterium]
MNSDFPRILTLLRKEKGISQKNAAAQLAISQALLSHYEKGIRECGLDFLVRCADFYGVSCDYLLGRSPDRQGSTITIDDIPDPEDVGKENRSIASVLPVLNKKLILNTLNILFDLLSKVSNKSLTTEVSAFLMLAVYKMFRVVYSANPKNQDAMFNVPGHVYMQYADAAMQISEANAASVSMGQPVHGAEGIANPEPLSLSTQSLEEGYPLFAPSLFNLIQNAEHRIGFNEKK